MERRGTARQGKEWQARHVMARPSMVRIGKAGRARLGKVVQGWVRNGWQIKKSRKEEKTMAINYEHLTAGAAVINKFRERLAELCGEYQRKLKEVCPEDISNSITSVAEDCYLRIQLTDHNRSDGYECKESEILADGNFSLEYSSDCGRFYEMQIDGVTITCGVHNETEG